jgi:hypothetical protein
MSPMTIDRTASSETECKNQPLLFQDLGSRKVVVDFSGGHLSSDGGGLLLRQIDRGLGENWLLAFMTIATRCLWNMGWKNCWRSDCTG